MSRTEEELGVYYHIRNVSLIDAKGIWAVPVFFTHETLV